MDSPSDEQLFAVIKYGGAAQRKSSLMPPCGGRLSDREIAALVAYLRASRENRRRRAARTLKGLAQLTLA